MGRFFRSGTSDRGVALSSSLQAGLMGGCREKPHLKFLLRWCDKRRPSNESQYVKHNNIPLGHEMQLPIEQCRQQSQQAGAPTADQEYFITLIETHHRLLLKVCWAYTNTADDRDDLFQEIVGRLWAAFAKYDRARKFSTWMYRVALNVAIDFRRRQARRWKESRSLDGAHEPQVVHDEPKQELIDEMHELLERLTEADRAILLLYLEGNSYREIAEVIGISQSNVGTRLNRLKQTLRDSAQATQ